LYKAEPQVVQLKVRYYKQLPLSAGLLMHSNSLQTISSINSQRLC